MNIKFGGPSPRDRMNSKTTNSFVGEKNPALKDGDTDSNYYVMKQIIYPALQGGDI